MAVALLGCSTTAPDRCRPVVLGCGGGGVGASAAPRHVDQETPAVSTTTATTDRDPHRGTVATADRRRDGRDRRCFAPNETVPTGGSAVAAAYAPPADAEPVDGDCPYLTKDQVQSDTGQRMGPGGSGRPPRSRSVSSSAGRLVPRDRPGPASWTDATAVAAVDFYVPRDTSNPESRPAGWAGGSMATDDGSIYAVSKDHGGGRGDQPATVRLRQAARRGRHREPRNLITPLATRYRSGPGRTLEGWQA